jgi:hypothetical protein
VPKVLPSQIVEAIDSLFGANRNELDGRMVTHNYRAEVHALLAALEEVAFAHVIMRHRDQIKPMDLPQVSALTRPDCQVWTANFDKCCGLMAGHDQSRGRNRATPEPDELLQDAQTLAAWVRNLRDRQKVIVQASSRIPIAAATEVATATHKPTG